MGSSIQTKYEINGVISTNKTVWQNLQTLASAAGCFLTFDIHAGKWAVIINEPGDSVYSFGDHNIIGAITISSTGVNELYNRVQIDFPHADLDDARDTIIDQIPVEDFYPNENDNLLSLSYDIINNPVHAEMLALRELKQSRVDKIIKFNTDYRALGLKAGDIIDVTSSVHSFTAKKFRIIVIEEADNESGSIDLVISALEYDANVYDYTDVYRYARSTKTGIPTDSANQSISNSNQEALLKQPLAILHAFQIPAISRPAAPALTSFGQSFVLPYNGNYKVTYTINWGALPTQDYPIRSGVAKISVITLRSGASWGAGTNIPLGDWAGTGDKKVQLFEDHFLQGFFTGTAGQKINYGIYTETNYGAGATFYSINDSTGEIYEQTVPANYSAAILVQVELYLLNRIY